MTKNKSDDYQLEQEAEKRLAKIIKDYRTSLLKSARDQAGERSITAHDLDTAVDDITKAPLPNRDAQATIDQALRENRAVELIAYGMALVLFCTGLTLLGFGFAGSHQSAVAVARLASGSIVELLILVPFRYAVNARRHNIALRMLEILLNRVDDPGVLTSLLAKTYPAIVVGKSGF